VGSQPVIGWRPAQSDIAKAVTHTVDGTHARVDIYLASPGRGAVWLAMEREGVVVGTEDVTMRG
jgi:hypothetical protein